MAMKKISVILLVCILLAMSFSGCAAFMESVEDPQIRAYTEQMLDAILDGDVTQARGAVSDAVGVQDFVSVFIRLQSELSQVCEYELKPISIYRNANYADGDTVVVVSASYRMDTNDGVYVVEVRTRSGYEKLVAFVVTPFEDTDFYHTGDLGHMKGAGIAQWIVLCSNILSYGLVIFAIVHCWRKKTKGKAGWIALCLLGAVSVGVTLGPTSFRTNFYLNGLFGYSAFLCYGGGTKVIRLLLPVGAVISLLFGGKERKQEMPWGVASPADVPSVATESTEAPVDRGPACVSEDLSEEMTTQTDDGQVPG